MKGDFRESTSPFRSDPGQEEGNVTDCDPVPHSGECPRNKRTRQDQRDYRGNIHLQATRSRREATVSYRRGSMRKDMSNQDRLSDRAAWWKDSPVSPRISDVGPWCPSSCVSLRTDGTGPEWVPTDATSRRPSSY